MRGRQSQDAMMKEDMGKMTSSKKRDTTEEMEKSAANPTAMNKTDFFNNDN